MKGIFAEIWGGNKMHGDPRTSTGNHGVARGATELNKNSKNQPRNTTEQLPKPYYGIIPILYEYCEPPRTSTESFYYS